MRRPRVSDSQRAEEHPAASKSGSKRATAAVAPFPTSEVFSNIALKVVATAAVLVLCYFGKPVLVTLMVALMLAFVLEPLVSCLERHRVARPIGAVIALLLVAVSIYAASYFSYVKAVDFARDLPKYSGRIRESVVRFRQQAQKVQEARQAIVPDQPSDKNAVNVKAVQSDWSSLVTSGGTVTEALFAASFIPFLAYFMLTWHGHIRSSMVLLFPREDRTTAYVTLSHIAQMLRSFIIGNALIGLIMGAVSAGVFWALGVPYFYFVGFISGFLSLVPYMGVILAGVAPLAAGFGTLSTRGLLGVAITVVVVHLLALNVLYPKILGSRLKLNPLIVTVSLLFWGFLWGAMGLLLAIPVTAAIKIILDHVSGLQPLGHLMGEGEEYEA